MSKATILDIKCCKCGADAKSLLKYKESNKDWNIFYMTYIGREVKLYEGKLCDEDKMKVNEDDELMRLSGEGNDNDNNNTGARNNKDNGDGDGDDNPFDFGKIGEDSDGIDLFDFNTGDNERNAKHKSNPKMDFIFEDFEFEDEPAQHIQNVDDDNNNVKSNDDEFEFPSDNDNDNVNIINDNHEENEDTTSTSTTTTTSSNYNDNIYWSIPLSSTEANNNKLLNEALQDLENE